jgi:hypothetical protein
MKKNIYIQTSAALSIFDRKPKSLSIDPSVIYLNDRFTTIQHLHFEIDNSYRFQILKGNISNLKLYLTGSWFTVGDYIINENMNPELLSSSISPGVYSEYTLKKLLVYLRFSLPLVSFTCRSAYSFARSESYEEFGPIEFLKEYSNLQLPNSLSIICASVGGQKILSNHIGIQAYYSFRYVNNSEPRVLKSISSTYSFGLFYIL